MAIEDPIGAPIKNIAEQVNEAMSVLENIDIDTLAELNAILTDANICADDDPRLTDNRDPNAHNHTASEVTDFDTEVSNNASVVANTSKVGITPTQASDITSNNAKNSYPSADSTKLSGIETSATADQTDTEIETAYNNRVAVVSQAAAEAGTSTTAERWTPERVKQAIVALGGTLSWQPPTMPLSAVLTSGATWYTNSGAGVYLNLDGASDDKFYFNYILHGANGVQYDGSDIKLKLHCRKGSSGSGTIGLIVDYSVIKDGDNTYTQKTNIAQQDTDVTSWTANIENDITLGTMTGVVGGHGLIVTVTRNSTGAGADTYSGDLEITGLEILKV